jgi:DNA-binding response OmpR family regulator
VSGDLVRQGSPEPWHEGRLHFCFSCERNSVPNLGRALEAAATERSGNLAVGDLVVDLPAREARLAGVPLSLSRRPFELLALLATEPGRAWPREVLYQRLWGADLSRTSRTLDRAAGRLRDELGHDWLKTVVGVGYALTPPSSAASTRMGSCAREPGST